MAMLDVDEDDEEMEKAPLDYKKKPKNEDKFYHLVRRHFNPLGYVRRDRQSWRIEMNKPGTHRLNARNTWLRMDSL